MELLKRAAEFVNRAFKTDVTLVYGDVQNDVVLYSNKQLEFYQAEGDVYVRKPDREFVDKNIDLLTSNKGYPYRVSNFGLSNFAYVHSAELLRKLKPDQYEKEDTFFLSLPYDVKIVHEGTHLILDEQQSYIEDFYSIVDDLDNNKAKFIFITETFAMFNEINYIDFYYPEIKDDHISWRLKGPNNIYKKAFKCALSNYKKLTKS